MMQCFLCLEAKEDIADFIQIKSSTWEELKVEDIILKHLWPSIMIKPKSQWFCLMCCNKLQDFHNFYVCIENAQDTQENIFNISHENTTMQTEYESQNEEECNNHGNSLVSVSMDSTVPTSIKTVKEEIEFISDNELEQHYSSSLGTIADNCNNSMDYTDAPVIDEELTSDADTDYAKSQPHSHKFPEGDSTIQTEYKSQSEGECKNHGTSLVSVSMNGAVPTIINIVKEEIEFISDNELKQYYNSSLDGINDDNCDDTNPSVIDEELASDDDTDYVKSQTHAPKSPEGDPTDIVSTTYYYQSRLKHRFHDVLLSRHIPLKCSNCELTFGNFVDLKKHSTNAHNKPAIIVCCGTEFDNRSLLVDHICCHINTQYFRCGTCPKVLTDRLTFKYHNRYHENERYTTCLICNIILYKTCYMNYHKLTHTESEDKQIPCKECGVFFTNEHELSRHMKIVHSLEMCKICGKSLTTAIALKLHSFRHDSPMRCNYCEVMVSNKIQLNKHFIERHTLKTGPNSYICQVCNAVSVSENAIRCHVRNKHTTRLYHKCGLCYKTFEILHDLQIHLNTHADFEDKEIHQSEDKNFDCPECNRCFSSGFLLSKHVNRMHVRKKCQVCEEVLPGIKTLRRHVEKHACMFCCEKCGLIVSSMDDLKEHLKLKHYTFDGTDKTSICPICNEVAITPNALKFHISRNHPSCSLHKCSRCNKSFKRKDVLKKHMKNKYGCK